MPRRAVTVAPQKHFHVIQWITGRVCSGLVLRHTRPDCHSNGSTSSVVSLIRRAREIQQQEGVPSIFWSSPISTANSSPNKEPTIPEGNSISMSQLTNARYSIYRVVYWGQTCTCRHRPVSIHKRFRSIVHPAKACILLD